MINSKMITIVIERVERRSTWGISLRAAMIGDLSNFSETFPGDTDGVSLR